MGETSEGVRITVTEIRKVVYKGSPKYTGFNSTPLSLNRGDHVD